MSRGKELVKLQTRLGGILRYMELVKWSNEDYGKLEMVFNHLGLQYKRLSYNGESYYWSYNTEHLPGVHLIEGEFRDELENLACEYILKYMKKKGYNLNKRIEL